MRTKNFYQVMGISTLTALAFIGCDDAKESAKNLSEQYELQGDFSSECIDVGVEGLDILSSQDQLDLSGNQLKVNTVYFSDVSCAEDSEVGRVVYNGEFEVERRNLESIGLDVEEALENAGEKIDDVVESESEERRSAEQLDEEQKEERDNLDAGIIKLNIESVEIQSSDQVFASLLNGINYCGRSDYEVDETVKLEDVSENIDCPLSEVPATLVGSYVFNEDENELTLSEKPSNMETEESEQVESSSDDEDEEVVVPSLSIINVFAPTYKKD